MVPRPRGEIEVTKFTGKFRVPGPRPLKEANKYGATKTFLDGYRFDSKLEAALYQILKLLVEKGDLKDLRHQHHVYLSRARFHCIPDFSAINTRTGKREYFEAKGFEDKRWGKVKKMWKAYGPGTMWIYKGSYNKLLAPIPLIPDEVECLCVSCDPMAKTGDEE